MESEEREIVINDVLCYLTTARSAISNNDMMKICIAFYNPQAILHSKDLLFEKAHETGIRRRCADKIRSELQDILDLLSKCDEEGKVIPKFVAESYLSLPPSSGFELIADTLVSLRDEISTLKLDLKQGRDRQSEHLQYYVDIREELADIKRDIFVMKSEAATKPRKSDRIGNAQDERNQEFVLEREGAKPKVIVEKPDDFQGKSRQQQLNAGPSYRDVLAGPKPANWMNNDGRRNNILRVNRDTETNDVRETDGFVPVRRRNRPQGIFGIRKANGGQTIKGAPRQSEIYVGGCEKDVSTDDIIKYLDEVINIRVVSCVALNCKNPRMNSFKVTIGAGDVAKLLTPEVWPENIVVRKFFS